MSPIVTIPFGTIDPVWTMEDTRHFALFEFDDFIQRYLLYYDIFALRCIK